MSPSQSNQLAEAFADALELKPEARDAYLESRLGSDPETLAQARRLIALHVAESGEAAFLSQPPAPASALSQMHAGPRTSDAIGQYIGPYRIVDTLGEGGMGVVYLAEQETPIRRTVAIKIIKPGMDSRQVIARFKAETDALARLDHPNIARIIDAGLVDDSAGVFGRDRPYLVMEYIAGPGTRDIASYCDEHCLTIHQRLELIATLCDALHHSHVRGVIHRDVKPSNVLVTDDGGRPRPRIIDFGVAKALMPSRAGEALTEHGQFIGTLEYLSPEQATAPGNLPDGGVDARADVYSLGVLAYQVITGALPLDPLQLNAGGHDAIRTIRASPRPKPSVRFTALIPDEQQTIARCRGLSSAEMQRQLRGDLDAVLAKAIEPDRDQRYATAADFAKDIRSLLAGTPVRIGRAIFWRWPGRIGRQQSALIIAAPVVVLALVLLAWGIAGRTSALAAALTLGVAGATWGVARSVVTAAVARRQRDVESHLRQVAQLAREESDRQRDEARHQAYVACMIAADAALRDHAYAAAKRRLAKAPEALRKWEWFYLRSRLADRSLSTLRGHASWVAGVACSSDGRLAASASRDATVRLWNLDTGETIKVLRGHDDLVQAVAFSPDATRLVSASWDRTVRVWDVATGQAVDVLHSHSGWIAAVGYSPDGRMIASGCSDGCVRLWDAATGELIEALRRHTGVVYCLAFGPDSATLACGGEDTGVHLWNVNNRSHLCELRGHRDWVRSVAFAPDGNTLASASADSTIKLWDVASQQELQTLRGHRDRVYSVAFSPDGKRIASSSSDTTVRFWNVPARQDEANIVESTVLHGHEARVFAVAFSSDGSRLVSGSEDATLKLWDAQPRPTRSVLSSEDGPVFAAAFSPDGRLLAAGSGDKTIDLWRSASEQRLVDRNERANRVGVVTLWDTNTAAVAARLHGHGEKVSSIAFSTDGARVASASYDRTVKLWRVPQFASGCEPQTLTETDVTFTGHTAWVFAVAFSPDARLLASAGGDRTVRLWDLQAIAHEGKSQTIDAAAATLRGHYDRVNTIAFSRDGRFIASGSSDGTVKLWNVATGKAVATLRGHLGWVLALAFSPDNTLLATGSSDNSIKVWRVGESLRDKEREPHISPPLTLRGHGTWVFSVAFSPDGSRLASGSWDNTVKIWDTTSGEELATLRGHHDRVNTVAFSPDGNRLASGSWDQTIKLWDRDGC